jgi:hypothetical protein
LTLLDEPFCCRFIGVCATVLSEEDLAAIEMESEALEVAWSRRLGKRILRGGKMIGEGDREGID